MTGWMIGTCILVAIVAVFAWRRKSPSERLFEAFRSHSTSGGRLEALLAKGVDPDMPVRVDYNALEADRLELFARLLITRDPQAAVDTVTRANTLRETEQMVDCPPILAAIWFSIGDPVSPISALLDAGANPNPPHELLGWSPLEMAAQKGYQKSVERLLAAGADPSRVKEGSIPMDLLLTRCDDGIRERIVAARGADDSGPIDALAEEVEEVEDGGPTTATQDDVASGPPSASPPAQSVLGLPLASATSVGSGRQLDVQMMEFNLPAEVIGDFEAKNLLNMLMRRAFAELDRRAGGDHWCGEVEPGIFKDAGRPGGSLIVSVHVEQSMSRPTQEVFYETWAAIKQERSEGV